MPEEQTNDGLNLSEEQKTTQDIGAMGESGTEHANEVSDVRTSGEEALDDADIGENQVQSASTEELVEGKVTEPIRSLEFLLDIPLELSVEIGRTKVEIKELLKLGPGSVVELDKLAGEPLDVYVNDRLVARGEVVIVNEKFGLRLTEVVSKKERLENLK